MGVLDKMNDAKLVDDRHPFIAAGPKGCPGGTRAEHKLALLEFFVYDSQTDGQAIGADLLVLESAVHQPGTAVACRWKINAPPRFKGDTGTGPRDEVVTFVAKLIGGTADDAKRMMRDQLLNGPAGAETNRLQPLRGTVISCSAEFVASRPKRDGQGMTKDFTRVGWTFVPGQSAEQIGALRAHMDGTYPLRARDVMPAPQQGHAHAPQGYGQPPPPAYPAQPPQGYGQPPPPAYPAQPPQGYGQPATPQPAPVTPAPAGYPPGLPPGFLVPGR